MWRRRPISRKASRPAFLGARSLRRLVIEMYSAKRSCSNVQHTRRETLVRETHSNRVRGGSSLGASDSIGACGTRIAPLEHFVVLVVVIVVVVYVPAITQPQRRERSVNPKEEASRVIRRDESRARKQKVAADRRKRKESHRSHQSQALVVQSAG